MIGSKKGWLSLLLLSAAALSGENKDLENFRPDPATSDIYIGHQRRIPLGGWWRIKRLDTNRIDDPNDAGKGIFSRPDIADAAWEKDLVPNNLNTPYRKRTLSHADKSHGGVVWYRKSFELPAPAKKERTILYFEDVVGAIQVWVNGKSVLNEPQRHPNKYAAYRGPLEPFSADITDAVRSGKNQLAIRLFHSGKPVFPWGGQVHGIMGRVWVDRKPEAWSDRILVTTAPDRKTVQFDALLSGPESAAKGWKGEIFEWKSGTSVANFPFDHPKRKHGLPFVSGKVILKDAKLWSPEHPFLYGLRIRNSHGEIAGVQRFGVRTFETKNGNFFLNGIPTMLRGRQFSEDELFPGRHGYAYGIAMNPENFARKYLQSFYKDLGINWIRMNNSRLSGTLCDLADELGLMITEELMYPQKRIENARRIDDIFVRTWDTACHENGDLTPAFQEELRQRIFLTYSHPSVCAYSFGNEIREFGRVSKMMNNIFDLYRKYDAQKRPVTPSSGRVYKEGHNMDRIVGEKFDYIDTHDYSGTGNETPLPYCGKSIRNFVDTVHRFFGRNSYPVINGECIYDGNRYWGSWFDGIWKNETDPQPDWDKYLACVDGMKKKAPNEADLSLYWIRIVGAKNYKYHRSEGYGVYIERVLEYQRAAWPGMDGFAALATPFHQFPLNVPDYKNAEFKRLPAFYAFRRICSPVLGYLGYLAPNQFTGKSLSTTASVVNNSETARSNIRMKLELSKNGKCVLEKTLDFGTVAPGEKKSEDLTLRLPGEAGDYWLSYRVSSEQNPLESDRQLNLRLRSAELLFAPLDVKGKKIGLIDASAAFGSLKPFSTVKILKKLNVPYKNVEQPGDLNGCDLLIIGNNSVSDPVLNRLGPAIKSYAEKGGRVLVFDQEFNGRYPFLPEISCSMAGPGQFSEIVRFDHPVMKGLDQKDFFLWNSKDQCIYRNFITPISKAAVTAGGNCAAWGVDRFGMITAHLRVGKGDILFSQAEVTENFTREPAAALLCRNMISFMLDDSGRRLASEYKAHPNLSVRAVADDAAVFLKLDSAANMAFADQTARDGKGGWTDQGPLQDLRAFPVGIHRFGNTLFRIADPAENGNRGCIVVSGHPKLPFKRESAPVTVNRKLARILFLYSGAWIGGNEVGEFVIRYKSGAEERVVLRNREHIADWLGVAPLLPKADCVWTSTNPVGIINAYAFDWKNPRPSDEIKQITVRALGPEAVIGLFGMTGEKIP